MQNKSNKKSSYFPKEGKNVGSPLYFPKKGVRSYSYGSICKKIHIYSHEFNYITTLNCFMTHQATKLIKQHGK